MEIQDFIRIFRKWRLAIIITPILTTIVAGFYFFQIALPVYSSGTQVVLLHQQNIEVLSGSDLVASSNLLNDYCVLVKTTPILEEAMRDTGITLEQLRSCTVVVTKVPETRVVTIAVSSVDGALAQKVVQAITNVSIEQAKEILQTENITQIEPSSRPKRTGPASLRNTAIALVVGLVLAAGFALLVEMLNTTVRTTEDVEKVLKIPVLAQIPRFGD